MKELTMNVKEYTGHGLLSFGWGMPWLVWYKKNTAAVRV